jgi:DNA/RNA endonuclease YhcR with UshA esterase domain
MKPDLLTAVCGISSAAGILMIYIATASVAPEQMPLSQIDFQMIGRQVYTTGYVSYVSKHPAGHIFLTLSDGSSMIEVPLFSGFVSSMKADDVSTNFKRGDVLEVEGMVEEYEGQLQIMPRKTADVRLVRDVS